jgi:excisionase family DNA binding protein
MKQDTLPEAMTIEGIAHRWGLSHWTVRTWIREGRIASFKVGRRVLVKVADIEGLMNESYKPARPRPA